MMVKGLYNPKLKLPRIPCSDGAGEVVGRGRRRQRCGSRATAWPESSCRTGSTGPQRPTKSSGALGGDIDGMLAEYRRAQGDRPGGDPRTPELPGSRHAALRRRDRLERAGGRRSEAGSTVLIQGTGGVSIFALQFARSAGRARARHLQQRREAGARLRAGPRCRPELPRQSRVGPLGHGPDRRRRRGPGRRSGRRWALCRARCARFAWAAPLRRSGCSRARPSEPSAHGVHPPQAGADSGHLRGLATGLSKTSTGPSTWPNFGRWARTSPGRRRAQALARMEEGSHFGKLVLTVE